MATARLLKLAAAIFALLVLLLVAAGYYLYRTGAVDRYVKRKIIEEGERRAGAKIELGEVRIKPLAMEVELRDLTVAGRAGFAAERPLFKVDRLVVRAKLISLRRRELDLRSIELYRPAISIAVNEAGENNIPRPARAERGRKLDLFALAVDKVLLEDGEFSYNDRRAPLGMRLEAMRLKLRFDVEKEAYIGEVSYAPGRVVFGRGQTFEHSLRASFAAGPTRLDFPSLVLSSREVELSASGSLLSYKRPDLSARYRAQVALQPLGKLLGQRWLEAGSVELAGAAFYRAEQIISQGVMRGQSVAINDPDFRTVVGSFHSRFALLDSRLRLERLAIDMLGGRLEAKVEIRELFTKQQFSAAARLNSLEASETTAAFPRLFKTEEINLFGSISGSADASWHGKFRDLNAQARLTVSGSTQRGPDTSLRIPLAGQLDLEYDRKRGLLAFSSSVLETNATRVEFEGSVADKSQLVVKLTSRDLSEADRLAVNLARLMKKPLGIRGAGWFSGTVSGRLSDPLIGGEFRAEPLIYRGIRWAWAGGQVRAGRNLLEVRQGRAEWDHSALSGNFKVALHNWKITPDSAVSASFQARRAPARDLQRLAGVSYPIMGTVSTAGLVSGRWGRPEVSAWVRIADGEAWGEKFASAAARVNLDGDLLSIRELVLVKQAGSLSASLEYNFKTKAYRLAAESPRLALEKLERLKPVPFPISGAVSLRAAGRGTLERPQLELSLRAPEIGISGDVFKNTQARAEIENDLLEFRLDSSYLGAPVAARGEIALSGDYRLESDLVFKQLPVGALLQARLPQRTPFVRGSAAGRARVAGPLGRPEMIRGEATLDGLSIAHNSISLTNAAPIKLSYRNGLLEVVEARLKGTGTELEIAGVVPLKSGRAIDLKARGKIGLELLQLADERITSAGAVNLDIRVTGSTARPAVAGRLNLSGGRISREGVPVALGEIQAEARFDATRLTVTRLTARAGSGEVRGSGFLEYGEEPARFDFSLKGEEVRVRYPEGARSLLNLDLALRGTRQEALLSGDVLLTRVTLGRDFDIADLVAAFTGPSQVVRADDGFVRRLRLDVRLRTPGEVSFERETLALRGQADLRLRGTFATPTLTGRIDATGSEVFFQGNRYHITRGFVDFVNPVRLEPALNMAAETRISDYLITINLAGPYNRMRVSYVSDPPLPTVDIVNLLVLGRPTGPGEATPSTPEAGAIAILSRAVSSEVSSRVGRLFGLSQFQIEPLLGGRERNPSARLLLRQNITRDLSVTYSANIGNAQQQLIQVEYAISRRFALTFSRDELGTFSADIRVRQRF